MTIKKSVLEKIVFAKSGFLDLPDFLLVLVFDKYFAFVLASLPPPVLVYFLSVKSVGLLIVVFNIEISDIVILLNSLINSQ